LSQAHSDRLDKLAIVLSALCLVHCLAVPLAVVALPVLGASLTGSETDVHWILLAMAIPLSVWAYARGYRHHGDLVATWSGGTGLVLMFLGVSHWFADWLEIPLTLVGVTLVSLGHFINMRHCRRAHGSH